MTEREAYQKSIERWERIAEVVDLLQTGMCDEGSKELAIPRCEMCYYSRENFGSNSKCSKCAWFDRCEKEGSYWKRINEVTRDLKNLVREYLLKAQEHTVKKPITDSEVRVEDIVQVKKGEIYEEKFGRIVIVDDENSMPNMGVEFTDYIGKHNCRGKGLEGHCYYMYEEQLTLVYREKNK